MKQIFKIISAISTIFVLYITPVAGQTGVAINGSGAAPDASALLDISGTGQGLLIPRMTLAQRPATPITGLLIYQTDSTPGFYYYDGHSWIILTTGNIANYLPLAGGSLTGKLITQSTSASEAGLNLPHGTAPASPVDGDIWTTSAGLFFRINGSTVGPFSNSSSNTFVQNGNSFGALAALGTNDNFDLAIKTNNTELMRIAASGSVGVGTSTFNGTNPEKLKADAGTSATGDYQNVIVGSGNTNSYAQINIKNRYTGTNASSDLVATADNGDDSNYYIDMGINSSAFNVGTFDVSQPNDGYLYVVGKADGSASGGNLDLGTANATKAVKFFTGGTRGTNERMRINGVGQVKISDLGNIITNDASSLLELESNTKGILIPRVVINNLALPAPLTAPSEGMLVYGKGGSVSNGFYYWTGSAWSLLGGSITLPLPVSSGGTGTASLGGTNTLLYTSATNTVANVPTSSADGQFLHTATAGSIPTWQTVLGIANGGTGSATQNFVDLTAGQTVGGIKTFSASEVFQAGFTSTGGTINLNASSNFPTNINTGTSTSTVAIGNTAGASSTTINAGTGGINLNTAAATDETTTLGTTGSAVFASSTANSDKIAILPQSAVNANTFTGSITSADLTAARTWTFPDVSGTLLTSASFPGWVLGGNAPGVPSVFGTTDNSAVTIRTGTGALNIGTDAAAKAITLGNATGATSATITSGTGGITLNTGTATNAITNLGTTGSAVFASSTAGSDKIAVLPQSAGVATPFTGTITTIDLTAARTWSLPDVSGTILTSGSFSGWLLGGNATAGAAIIGTTDNSSMTVQTGTGALNLGTDAAAKAITLGNATGATSATITSGTGGVTLNTGAATNATTNMGTTGSAVFASSTANSDKIAILPQSTVNTNTFTGTITSVDLTAARTWTFPDISGTLLTSGSFSGWLLGGNATAGAAIIGTTDNSAMTVQTGTGALNLGTDAAAKAITLGNATGATSATITSGTGGVTLNTGAATNATTNLGTTGSAVFASSTANSDKIAILPQSTVNTNTFTGSITSADLTAARTWTFPDVSGTLLTSGSFSGWLLGGNATAGAAIIGTTDNSTLTVQTGTGALNLGTDAFAKAVTLGNATGATSATITSGTGGITFNTGTATNATTNLGTTGSAVFASSTNNSDKISIQPQSTINTATFTGAITSADLTGTRTWTLPDASGTVALTTGANAAWLVGGNSPGGASVIGTNDGSAVTFRTGTGALNLGTDAAAKAITIGNVTVATTITENVGGNYILDGIGASTYTIGAATTSGTIAIGGTAQTGNMTLGSSSGINNLFIANGSGATTLNLANVQNAGAINMGAGMTAGTITIGGISQTGNMTLGSSSGINNLFIANGSGATTLNLANIQNGGAINMGAGMTSGTITIGGTGAQTGTIGIGTGTGAQTLNFGTGGTGAKTVNIGTGAAANPITIGTTNTTASTAINAGSGNLTITAPFSTFQTNTSTDDQIKILPNSGGAARFLGTITSTDLTAARTWTFPDASGTLLTTGNAWLVGGNAPGAGGPWVIGTTDNSSVSLNSGTGALNIGADTWAKTITLGNVTGATSLNLNVGTGNFALNGVGASSYTIGAATTTGAISIGGSTQTGPIMIGSSNTGNTISIANGSGTPTLNLANVTNGGAINMGAGMTTGIITIGGAAQTGTITLGNSTTAQMVNLGAGSGASTVNIGTGSAVRISGTGNVGIATTTPAAKLDVNGSIKLGPNCPVLSGILKTSVVVTDNTAFSYNQSVSVNITVTGAAVNSTVIVNPRTALTTAMGIGYSYVSAANTVTINFTNTGTANVSVGTKTFDITIIQ